MRKNRTSLNLLPIINDGLLGDETTSCRTLKSFSLFDSMQPINSKENGDNQQQQQDGFLLLQEESSDTTTTKSLPISDRNLGILVLLTVPLCWGTYGPTVRYLYELQPPVPGFVFSASYYTLAAFTMLILSSFQQQPNNPSSVEQQPLSDETTHLINNKDDSDEIKLSNSFPIMGGLELGMYLFVANCLQVVGLQTVPSDRAGFLVQLTTVMVPLAEALFAGSLLKVPIRTWGACLLAFLGISIMGLDGKTTIVDGLDGSWNTPSMLLAQAVSSFTTGDCLIVSAAALYTLHVVRLGRYAKESQPIMLAASKATTEAILSTGLVLALATYSMGMGTSDNASSSLLQFAADTGNEIILFFSSLVEGVSSGTLTKSALVPAIGAILWTSLVTCSYTLFAQSFGQARVR